MTLQSQFIRELSPKICFLHIMKTAGMTLRPFIEQNFARSEVGDPVAILNENGAPPEAGRKLLARYRYLRGHDNYAEIMPDGFAWITVLREPVARIKSLYRFWQDSQRHVGDSEETLRLKNLANEMSLPDLLRHDHPGLSHFFHDGMCKVLVPSFPVRRCEQMSDEQLVEAACQTLDRMACVGIMERFDDFVRLLCYTMRWVPPRAVQTLNVSRISETQMQAEPSEAIERAVRLDRIVYKHACSIFERQYARMVEDLIGQSAADAQIAARARQALVEAGRGATMQLPARVSVSMGEPIRGDGWLEREGIDVGRMYRWTGPGRRSTLDVLVRPAREYVVEVRVINVIYPDILGQAKVCINGVESRYCMMERGRDVTTLRAVIPGQAVEADGFAQIQLEVPRTASHLEVHPECGDARQKGLAISGMEIYGQVEESVFAAWSLRTRSLLRRARGRLLSGKSGGD